MKRLLVCAAVLALTAFGAHAQTGVPFTIGSGTYLQMWGSGTALAPYATSQVIVDPTTQTIAAHVTSNGLVTDLSHWFGTAGSPATPVITVQGPSSGGTALPVSGTFWQTTQPVSMASAPLPTAAAPAVSTTNAVTSLVLKASATVGGVKYYHAENATATGGYCILYNASTAPSTGALTAANVLGFQLLPASGYCDWAATNIPVSASTGAVLLVSSAATPFTYTTGIITAAIYGLAQ